MNRRCHEENPVPIIQNTVKRNASTLFNPFNSSVPKTKSEIGSTCLEVKALALEDDPSLDSNSAIRSRLNEEDVVSKSLTFPRSDSDCDEVSSTIFNSPQEAFKDLIINFQSLPHSSSQDSLSFDDAEETDSIYSPSTPMPSDDEVKDLQFTTDLNKFCDIPKLTCCPFSPDCIASLNTLGNLTPDMEDKGLPMCSDSGYNSCSALDCNRTKYLAGSSPIFKDEDFSLSDEDVNSRCMYSDLSSGTTELDLRNELRFKDKEAFICRQGNLRGNCGPKKDISLKVTSDFSVNFCSTPLDLSSNKSVTNFGRLFPKPNISRFGELEKSISESGSNTFSLKEVPPTPEEDNSGESFKLEQNSKKRKISFREYFEKSTLKMASGIRSSSSKPSTHYDVRNPELPYVEDLDKSIAQLAGTISFPEEESPSLITALSENKGTSSDISESNTGNLEFSNHGKTSAQLPKIVSFMIESPSTINDLPEDRDTLPDISKLDTGNLKFSNYGKMSTQLPEPVSFMAEESASTMNNLRADKDTSSDIFKSETGNLKFSNIGKTSVQLPETVSLMEEESPMINNSPKDKGIFSEVIKLDTGKHKFSNRGKTNLGTAKSCVKSENSAGDTGNLKFSNIGKTSVQSPETVSVIEEESPMTNNSPINKGISSEIIKLDTGKCKFFNHGKTNLGTSKSCVKSENSVGDKPLSCNSTVTKTDSISSEPSKIINSTNGICLKECYVSLERISIPWNQPFKRAIFGIPDKSVPKTSSKGDTNNNVKTISKLSYKTVSKPKNAPKSSRSSSSSTKIRKTKKMEFGISDLKSQPKQVFSEEKKSVSGIKKCGKKIMPKLGKLKKMIFGVPESKEPSLQPPKTSDLKSQPIKGFSEEKKNVSGTINCDKKTVLKPEKLKKMIFGVPESKESSLQPLKTSALKSQTVKIFSEKKKNIIKTFEKKKKPTAVKPQKMIFGVPESKESSLQPLKTSALKSQTAKIFSEKKRNIIKTFEKKKMPKAEKPKKMIFGVPESTESSSQPPKTVKSKKLLHDLSFELNDVNEKLNEAINFCKLALKRKNESAEGGPSRKNPKLDLGNDLEAVQKKSSENSAEITSKRKLNSETKTHLELETIVATDEPKKPESKVKKTVKKEKLPELNSAKEPCERIILKIANGKICKTNLSLEETTLVSQVSGKKPNDKSEKISESKSLELSHTNQEKSPVLNTSTIQPDERIVLKISKGKICNLNTRSEIDAPTPDSALDALRNQSGKTSKIEDPKSSSNLIVDKAGRPDSNTASKKFTDVSKSGSTKLSNLTHSSIQPVKSRTNDCLINKSNKAEDSKLNPNDTDVMSVTNSVHKKLSNAPKSVSRVRKQVDSPNVTNVDKKISSDLTTCHDSVKQAIKSQSSGSQDFSDNGSVLSLTTSDIVANDDGTVDMDISLSPDSSIKSVDRFSEQENCLESPSVDLSSSRLISNKSPSNSVSTKSACSPSESFRCESDSVHTITANHSESEPYHSHSGMQSMLSSSETNFYGNFERSSCQLCLDNYLQPSNDSFNRCSPSSSKDCLFKHHLSSSYVSDQTNVEFLSRYQQASKQNITDSFSTTNKDYSSEDFAGQPTIPIESPILPIHESNPLYYYDPNLYQSYFSGGFINNSVLPRSHNDSLDFRAYESIFPGDCSFNQYHSYLPKVNPYPSHYPDENPSPPLKPSTEPSDYNWAENDSSSEPVSEQQHDKDMAEASAEETFESDRGHSSHDMNNALITVPIVDNVKFHAADPRKRSASVTDVENLDVENPGVENCGVKIHPADPRKKSTSESSGIEIIDVNHDIQIHAADPRRRSASVTDVENLDLENCGDASRDVKIHPADPRKKSASESSDIEIIDVVNHDIKIHAADPRRKSVLVSTVVDIDLPPLFSSSEPTKPESQESSDTTCSSPIQSKSAENSDGNVTSENTSSASLCPLVLQKSVSISEVENVAPESCAQRSDPAPEKLCESSVEVLEKERPQPLMAAPAISNMSVLSTVAASNNYGVDYINETESLDQNNPNWDYWRLLTNDEERYKAVRRAWKNLRIPNPKLNLTIRNWQKRHGCPQAQMLQRNRENFEPAVIPFERIFIDQIAENMRKHKEDVDALQDQMEYELNSQAMNHENAMRNCLNGVMAWNMQESHCANLQRTRQYFNNRRNTADQDLQNRRQRLLNVCNEVTSFHSFYDDLDCSGVKGESCTLLTRTEYEEITEINQMINKYPLFYGMD